MYTEKKMYVSVCRHIAHKFWILNYLIFPNDMAYDFYKYCAYRIKYPLYIGQILIYL